MSGAGNGQLYGSRLDALERWQVIVDEERGQVVGELSRLAGLVELLPELISAAEARISARLGTIEDRLDERPSRAEFQDHRKQLDSLRAKAKKPTKLTLWGPLKLKLELLGVSGVTIVLSLIIVALVVALFVLVWALWARH